jgi:phospholipase/lecithinase/hemolysin
LLPFALAALVLGGCGGAVKVQPSASTGSSKLASRGRIDNPATATDNHLGCLQAAHLPVQVISPTQLQVGAAPAGPTIVFTASPAVAQAKQIQGKAQPAEVIGSALVYPNQGSDRELASIGACLAQGVQQ